MKSKAMTSILSFVAVVRSLFPQLGLLEPSEYRFGGEGEQEGHLAGIIDEKNGIIDIADGAEHVVIKCPPGTRIGRMRWNVSEGDAPQLFQDLGIELNMKRILGHHQVLTEHDLENGVISVKRRDQYAAFTIPRGTPVNIQEINYRERRNKAHEKSRTSQAAACLEAG